MDASMELLLFLFLAFVTLVGGFGLLVLVNPIYAAFSLILTMIGISGLFATLGADFIAGVQLIVYAGAVLVLFVMVLMLFDLKEERRPFSRQGIALVLIALVSGLGLGLAAGSIYLEGSFIGTSPISVSPQFSSVKVLGTTLFTRYMIIFQLLGVLLLVVAVGAVALARAKGGTHDSR